MRATTESEDLATFPNFYHFLETFARAQPKLALKLLSEIRHPSGPPMNWGMLGLGMVVSAVVAFVAVRWMLDYLKGHTFVAFGWYRIAVGILVLVLAVIGMRG